MGSSHLDLCTFMKISRSFMLKIKKSFRWKLSRKSRHFMFRNFFFFWKLCHLWDNVEKYGRTKQATDDYIIWHKRYACWMT